MNKYSAFLLLILVILMSGCSETNDEQKDNPSVDSNRTIEVTIEFDNNGTTTSFSALHIDRYTTFDEMVQSEIGEFHKVKVNEIVEFSIISNTLICTDYESGKTINVVLYKSYDDILVNDILYLHLVYIDSIESYMLSDLDDSIFHITSNQEVIIPSSFVTQYGYSKISENVFTNEIQTRSSETLTD